MGASTLGYLQAAAPISRPGNSFSESDNPRAARRFCCPRACKDTSDVEVELDLAGLPTYPAADGTLTNSAALRASTASSPDCRDPQTAAWLKHRSSRVRGNENFQNEIPSYVSEAGCTAFNAGFFTVADIRGFSQRMPFMVRHTCGACGIVLVSGIMVLCYRVLPD